MEENFNSWKSANYNYGYLDLNNNNINFNEELMKLLQESYNEPDNSSETCLISNELLFPSGRNNSILTRNSFINQNF